MGEAVSGFYVAKVSKGNKIGLVPTDAQSEEAIGRLGDGECIYVKFARHRSVQWHRMYFGICREIGLNQEPMRDEDSIDMELRVLAGHYTVIHARKGNELYEVRMPKRIAFDKLTADEWAELWPSLELAGRERFGDEYFDQTQRAVG